MNIEDKHFKTSWNWRRYW